MNTLRIFTLLLVATALLSACGPASRRAEIEQRKEALKQKQDSALGASQQELAAIDSALQAAEAWYEVLLQRMNEPKTPAQELQYEQALTRARLHRDSLQISFDVLCGKIKYIHRKQAE